MNSYWCEKHLRCFGCDKNLSRTVDPTFGRDGKVIIRSYDNKEAAAAGKETFLDFDGKPTCKSCFESLPFEVRKSLVKFDSIERKSHKLAIKLQS